MPPTATRRPSQLPNPPNLQSLNQQKLRKLDLAVTGVGNNRSPMTSPKTPEGSSSEADSNSVSSDGATDCDSVEEDIGY